MSSHRLAPPIAPARPVADAPAQELAERAEELARGWAFALLAAHPLHEMTAVPLEEIARHAPALCASVARALSSEDELRSLCADEPREPGALALSALAATWDAPQAAEHVEALRRVLWEATREALADPAPREVADLADRLGAVCSALLRVALGPRPAGSRREQPRGSARSPGERVLYRAPRPSPERPGAVLIDEHQDAPQPSGAHAPVEAPARVQPRAVETEAHAAPRPLPWDIPLQGGARSATAASARAQGDEVLRVTRGPLAPRADRAD